MDNLNLISVEQLYKSLIGIILFFTVIHCVINLVDFIFYFYHKWIKKDLSIISVKTNWKDLL